MRCMKLRKIIVTVPTEERSEQLQQSIERHLDECPACTRYVQEMTVLTTSLQALPARQAPEDFADEVKSRLADSQCKPRVGWPERIFGVHRPAAPRVSPRWAWGTAAAAVVALAVGLLVTVPQDRSPVHRAETTVVAIEPDSEAALPTMDEMMLRHRRYSRSYSLTDDPGSNLISYSPGNR